MPQLSLIKLLSLFVILFALSLSGQYVITRYNVINEQVLNNPSFEDNASSWKKYEHQGRIFSTKKGEITLKSNSNEENIHIKQVLRTFEKKHRLRLRATVKTSDIEQGEKNWNTGRITLVQKAGKKNNFRHPHILVSLTGNDGWASYSKTFSILADTSEIDLNIELNRCTGTLTVKEINLSVVEERIFYRLFKCFLLLSWGLFSFCIIFSIFRAHDNVKHISVITAYLLLSFIIVGASHSPHLRSSLEHELSSLTQFWTQNTQPGKIQSGSHKTVKKQTETPDTFSMEKPDPMKAGHFILFFLLAALIRAACPHISYSTLVFNFGLLAAANESLQILIEGRGPHISDWVIDMSGVMLAFGIFFLVTSFRRREGERG